jgi:hypothetical protein
MSMYRYLITYVHDNGRAMARVEITIPAPIRSVADVETVERALRTNTGIADAFVLSFSPFTHNPTTTRPRQSA